MARWWAFSTNFHGIVLYYVYFELAVDRNKLNIIVNQYFILIADEDTNNYVLIIIQHLKYKIFS